MISRLAAGRVGEHVRKGKLAARRHQVIYHAWDKEMQLSFSVLAPIEAAFMQTSQSSDREPFESVSRVTARDGASGLLPRRRPGAAGRLKIQGRCVVDSPRSAQ